MAVANIEITEYDLRKLVREYLSLKMGIKLDDSDIKIETKSKQNYKSEWESAEFRARASRIL